MTAALRGLSSMATGALLAVLATRAGSRTGLGCAFVSAGGVDVARRVREHEHADLLVLDHSVMATLGDEGLLVPGTLRPLFASDAVLAVPSAEAAASVPAPGSTAALVALLRGADRIAYSTGPSGTGLLRRLVELGLREELASRLVQAPPGVGVGTLLAEGRASLGLQQRSELTGTAGVQVLGPLPGDLALRTVFGGAVLRTSVRPEDAATVLRTFVDDEASALVEEHALAPVPRAASEAGDRAAQRPSR